MSIKKKVAIISIVIIFTVYIFKINYSTRGIINNTINKIQGKTLNKSFNTKIKSGDLSTDYVIEEALNDIKKFQLNTLNIPIVINIEDIYSSNMAIDNYSKEKAIKLIKKLKGKKINIILEPYPWIENGSKNETQWKPDNIGKFFYNWKTKVLKPLIEDVAIPYHVDAFNIASSLVHMEEGEGDWCDTIDYVRKYYKGLITYRTSWWINAEGNEELLSAYNKKLNNKLFSKVDFISIAAYFELTDKDRNTVEDIVKAIESTEIYNRKQNVKKEIIEFYYKWNKPIFFGELGFPRTDKASMFPWNPYASTNSNNLEQSNCFEAYRKVFENEGWNLGFSVFALGEHSESKLYYPSSESTLIIRNWFK